jgi:enoyl-CoA hydratase
VSTQIVADVKDGIATIVMDGPSSRNALDVSAMELLADELDRLERLDDVRCLILTGAGGAFSAGADLDAMQSSSGPDGDRARAAEELSQNRTMMSVVSRAITSLISFRTPVIARVDGAAAGVGASIALACDLVIASRRAFFLLPFTGIGLIPDGGATLTVAASIGRARALRLALLRERLTATAAYEAGLIAAVCEESDLDQVVSDWAAQLADGPPTALSRTKAAINTTTLGDLATTLTRESDEQVSLLASPDYREGVEAFFDHRQPDFRGT